MAATPQFKAYSESGEYLGSMKHIEDCAAVVALRCSGTIRNGHRNIIWHEGHEHQSAGESYDFVAATCHQRIQEIETYANK